MKRTLLEVLYGRREPLDSTHLETYFRLYRGIRIGTIMHRQEGVQGKWYMGSMVGLYEEDL